MSTTTATTTSACYNIILEDLSRNGENDDGTSVPLVTTSPFDSSRSAEANILDFDVNLRRSIAEGNRIGILINSFQIGEVIENGVTCSLLRTKCKRMLTEHTRSTSIRTYRLFEFLGKEQIYRTKFMTRSDIRKLKKREFQQLLKEGTNIATLRIAQTQQQNNSEVGEDLDIELDLDLNLGDEFNNE